MSVNELKTITLSAPASLLLFGEYFITQANTSSLCMAVNTRAIAQIKIHQHNNNTVDQPIQLTCIGEHKKPLTIEAHNNALFASCQKTLSEQLPRYKKTANPMFEKNNTAYSVKICIDTCAFFTHTNNTIRKKGLGSSETTAVLMCACLAILQGLDPLHKKNKYTLAHHAALAHKNWQNGKGSGYGVYTSIFGNLGIYTQKKNPLKNKWKNLHTFYKKYFSTFVLWFWNEPQSVISKDSIKKYDIWKNKNPRQHILLYKKYNTTFKKLIFCTKKRSVDMQNFFLHCNTLKNISLELGKNISISAFAQQPKKIEKILIFFKSLGAGNESVLGFSNEFIENTNNADNNDVQNIKIDTGITYEY